MSTWAQLQRLASKVPLCTSTAFQGHGLKEIEMKIPVKNVVAALVLSVLSLTAVPSSAVFAQTPQTPPAGSSAGSTSSSTTTTTKAKTTSTKAAVTPQTPPSPGMVWVNTNTKVYHKSGSKYYGATSKGKWMTEADAQKAGYKAASN
jgi:hypothetical protein